MAIVESAKINTERDSQKSIVMSSAHSDEKTHLAPTVQAPKHERDLLSQFKMNLEKVESLSRRLQFVLGEVEQVLRKY